MKLLSCIIAICLLSGCEAQGGQSGKHNKINTSQVDTGIPTTSETDVPVDTSTSTPPSNDGLVIGYRTDGDKTTDDMNIIQDNKYDCQYIQTKVGIVLREHSC